MADDLMQTIAWWRDALGSDSTDDSVTPIRSDDLRLILDAAEAGMRAKAELAEEHREFLELQWELLQRTGGGTTPSGYRGARNEALEEAAKVAEDSEPNGGHYCNGAIKEHSSFIAFAIRALKEKSNG